MPKTPTYSPSKVERAVREIQNSEGCSLRAVAKKYGIPRATLQFKIKNPGHKTSFGPTPVLTDEEENTIVRWIIQLAQKGFPRKREDILSSVQQFLIENPRPNPFKNNRPGEGWLKAFLKRHPEIALRSSEAVTGASACVTESDLRKWFADISKYIEEKHLENVISDPSRVFNGDETGFQICPATGRVLAPKGCKNVYSIDHGSSKENITVMFTFSADGNSCNPMIVFPYERIPEKIAKTVPVEWGIGRSESGWMTAHTFYEFIANVFHPFLIKNGIQLPVILFLDGHRSHLTYHLSLLCTQLNIEVIALYPNATRIIQPADVAVFRPIKMSWLKAVREWHTNHPGEAVTKITFATILKKVVDSTVKPETLKNGFKACGLYPFDPNAVDYSKCLGGSKKSNENREEKKTENDKDSNDITMKYSVFCNIVGEDKIEKFNQIQNIVESSNDDDFFTLYKLWKYYQPDQMRLDNQSNNNNLSHENENDFKKDSFTLNNENNNNQRIENISANIEDIPNELDRQTDNVEDVRHSLIIESAHPDDWVEDNDGSQATMNENASAPDVLPETNSNASSSVPKTKFTKHMSEYFAWPESPKRKGKRNTERFPFAVTSQKYRNMFEKKNMEKLNIQKEIERKKKAREEAKMAKTAKVSTKNIEKKKTPQCSVCKKLKCELKCDHCKGYYHRICIPKSHQKHIPELDDNDNFLCHKCYKEDESDDSVEVQTDEESVDMLYDLYMQNKHL